MWKYQCKNHLMIVAAAFLAGALLLSSQARSILPLLQDYGIDSSTLKSSFFPYLMGGIMASGIANAGLLLYYGLQKLNFPIIYLVVLIFFNSVIVILESIGVILLVPAIFVCLYGMLSIPNRGIAKGQSGAATSVAEVERIYRLHHTYDESYEPMAAKIWRVMMQINIVYALGVIGLSFVLLYVQDTVLIFIAFLLYMFVLFGMTRKRAQIVQPIVALLYEQCNPEACASAIFALARKSKKKKNFPLPHHLAQSMIYLNDPHLAIDVLVTCKRSNPSVMCGYHSLMAYAYYQLGDGSTLKRHYDECQKINARGINTPLNMVKQQCLEGIQNKIDLMEKDFQKAKAYFDKGIVTLIYEFQKVDYQYYTGLIAFVDRDLRNAKDSFSYVVNHGHSMYFTQKAKTFLETIEKAETVEE